MHHHNQESLAMNMMISSRTELTLVLVLLLCSVLSKCSAQPFKPALNCARLDCASYTVVHTDNDVEIRSYKEATWVSSPKIHSKYYTEASNKGFRILFNYFRGNNREHVKINMTSPVLIDIDQNSTYTVYFYVPEQYRYKLPAPLSKDVKPVALPRKKYVAVRRFPGFLSQESIGKELDALRKSLQGTPYQKAANADSFTVGGYNSPFELFNRVNEVFLWFDSL